MAEGSNGKANVLIGTIELYVVGTSFTNYSERLEYLFQVNGIDDPGKQKALFATLSGPAVYEELKLLYPSKDDLKNVGYGDISQKLHERFDKVDSDLIQRYKFYNRVQGPNEKAEDFVLAVKLQAEFCAFGEFRETAIRDKLVMGVFDKSLQEKLLNEENPSLATVERFIVNWELAGSRARMIGDRQGGQVASVKQRLGRKETFNRKVSRDKSRSRSRSAVYKRQGRSRSAENFLLEIKQKYSQVFSKDLTSPIIGFEADLVLKDNTPIFERAYEVPFRLRENVIEYLGKLEKENVITPIKTSEWASPVVVVPKKDAQDIFADLAGCKVFCALDLEGAYTQLMLSEKSRKFVVINTIKGLYTYNRLPQGASSSAAIFQQVMNQVLAGLKHIRCYLDDVLIAGKDLDDCPKKVSAVLDRLAQANIKVNWSKFDTKCLQRLASDGATSHKAAVKVVEKDFYVDDLLTGTDSLEEGTNVNDF
ncbi:uncharacterized protein LOC131679904 [Topomyia yanbarensis]|uniref:uncharacterized protein LOC131679904 n=1 Tax=Topomyia yanbarensis TaxID=2498891 RepID=UPI00273A7562|nr:uncharacterized protein LOC131679904 [Topomyia yanbarensis]